MIIVFIKIYVEAMSHSFKKSIPLTETNITNTKNQKATKATYIKYSEFFKLSFKEIEHELKQPLSNQAKEKDKQL